ncbi:MAG TPA: TetR/AcrR family transcriptional regulator [Chitinophagales bacterium]|nr:TetR/AcrR family transcriptional regulator [Chitinophagales bacterium]
MNVLSEEVIDKKEWLFKTTVHLVAKNGFHGTSMSMISKESEIAIGTIYHYFKSKDDLILEVLLYTKQKFYDVSFGEDDSTKDFYERFKALWSNLYEHMVLFPEKLSYISQYFSSPFAFNDDRDTFCFQSDFGSFIQPAKEQKIVQDIPLEILSSIFLGSVINSAKQFSKTKQRLQKNEINIMVDTIWNGIKIK